METRKYVVKQIDAEGEPIITKGICRSFVDDEELVPDGYVIDYIQNSPKIKTVYVRSTSEQ